jgi:spermidine synthase
MIPWILVEKVSTNEQNKELKLYQRDSEYSIKIGNYELMNSRAHSSEDELGRLTCLKIKKQSQQKILIGGLGMGFTLRVALNNLKPNAQVIMAELLPVVIKWNRENLSHLAKNPLSDKRVTVYEGDVVTKIREQQNYYHAIILDVDNGPQGLTQTENNCLYSNRGLKSAYDALQTDGVLAIWSAASDDSFVKRLEKVGFTVTEERLRIKHGPKGGGQAVVWIAQKLIKERNRSFKEAY